MRVRLLKGAEKAMSIYFIRSCFVRTCLLLTGTVLLLGPSGCSTLHLNRFPWSAEEEVDEVPIGGKARLVGDLAVGYGQDPMVIEAVGLVTGLEGTGSNPALSGQRDMLIDDMQRRGVKKPTQILASNSTAMVMVRGVLRPGIQKGDKFDLEVRCPSQSDTSSLRGGWLLEARLTQMGVFSDKRLHQSDAMGLAEGAVLIDPTVDIEKNPILACRGRILSGGTALDSRNLGLVLKENKQNVFNAAQIQDAINRRFFINRPGGYQDGVAKAVSDKYVELKVHPTYKDNVPRYLQVVRSIALHESTVKREERIALLQEQLLDPLKTRGAALQLEAIGKYSADALKSALASENIEIRFRAAEALAYLGQPEAAEVLGKVALEEPAFRVFALAALGVMNNDYESSDALKQLLDVPSVETRYGAFRMLSEMHRIDTEYLGEKFHYCVIPSSQEPIIHVTNSRRPEVVLFGADQKILTPCLITAGPRIRIHSDGGNEISITRFGQDKLDQKRIVVNQVDNVVRAIVELGGTYPDVVQAIQEAKVKGLIASRFEIDALPDAGRTYHRDAKLFEPYEVAEEPSWWRKLLPGGLSKDKDKEELDAESEDTLEAGGEATPGEDPEMKEFAENEKT